MQLINSLIVQDHSPGKSIPGKKGSVYFYRFSQHLGLNDETYAAEPRGMRSVVMMDANPYERFLHNLDLHVVPLSNKAGYKNDSVKFQYSKYDTYYAVTSQATTINSRELMNYSMTVDDRTMRRIASSLDEQLSMVEDIEPGLSGAPGSIVDVPWNGPVMRRFVIVGNAHIKNGYSPIMAVPVDSLDDIDGNLTGLKPRPLSRNRMQTGILRDQLARGDTERLQAAVRAIYCI